MLPWGVLLRASAIFDVDVVDTCDIDHSKFCGPGDGGVTCVIVVPKLDRKVVLSKARSLEKAAVPLLSPFEIKER